MTPTFARIARIEALHEAAAERILVLDGSWGAKIQELRLTEEDFRGERFADHSHPLQGQQGHPLPDAAELVITELLDAYLDAGADIVSTNTFTATTIAQADYGTAGRRPRHQRRRRAARPRGRGPASRRPIPRGRAGSPARSGRPTGRCRCRPTSTTRARARSTSTRSTTPTASRRSRSTTAASTCSWSRPIFDTLNAKAALKAILDLEDEGRDARCRSGSRARSPTARAARCRVRRSRRSGPRSATPSRSPSGSTARSAPSRCGRTSPSSPRVADTLVSAYPNAGLPNELGEYDEGPDETSAAPARVGAGRARQHRRRLLRHDARPHPRDRRRGRGRAAAPGPGDRSRRCGLSGLEPFAAA